MTTGDDLDGTPGAPGTARPTRAAGPAPRGGGAGVFLRSAAILVVVVFAATAAVLWAEGGNRPSDADGLRRRAQAQLARWADAVAAAGGQGVVVTGDLTAQLGDWEPVVGDNGKAALMAGLVEAAGPLPVGASAGEMRWADGTTRRITLLTAAQAIARIRSDAEAARVDLTPLRVTGARLVTGEVATDHGPATVPEWELALEGTAVRLSHVAVASVVRVASPASIGSGGGSGGDAPAGIRVESASVAADGRELTVTFVGAPGPGSQPCGADYSAEPVTSGLAVVVIVSAHANPLPVPCSAVGAMRTASLTLSEPLGDRTVLDGVTGRPVPVVRER